MRAELFDHFFQCFGVVFDLRKVDSLQGEVGSGQSVIVTGQAIGIDYLLHLVGIECRVRLLSASPNAR